MSTRASRTSCALGSVDGERWRRRRQVRLGAIVVPQPGSPLQDDVRSFVLVAHHDSTGAMSEAGRNRDHLENPARRPVPATQSSRAWLPSRETTPGRLVRLAQQGHERLWQRHVGAGLTSIQFGVLLTLGANGSLDQRRIGDAMSLDKSNVADVLLRLARRGLVESSRDPHDGRRRVQHLLPAGRVMLQGTAPGAAKVQSELLAPLADDARQGAVNILGLVAFRGPVPTSPSLGAEVDSIPDWPADVPAIHLKEAPGYLIRRAQQVHTTIWTRHVGADITSVQYAVLLALAEHAALDQRTLGSQVSLDKSTGGELLARMVSRGLIDRDSGSDDRRRKLVRLTSVGRSEMQARAWAVELVQQELLEPLTPEQRQQFVTAGVPGGVRRRVTRPGRRRPRPRH